MTVDVEPGESLLSVLRERLGRRGVKDGCAPQGQCGCCTVLVDGEARVACVTAATRVDGRSVTTIDGLEPAQRDRFAAAFLATGGSQCGFCTPGIVVRLAALAERGRTAELDLDRALAAHLCRCTGWQTIEGAFALAVGGEVPAVRSADVDTPGAHRAQLEGGVAQQVHGLVPLGRAGFADDSAPADALVAVPLPPGSDAEAVEAAGIRWVIGESLADARGRAAKVQGRRSTVAPVAPFPVPDAPAGGVALVTGWVEPAYLEPDASWCAPGGVAANPLANGGAFGGKVASPAPAAAAELAERTGRTVRVVFSREDCVRLGPKRPPMAATAVWSDGVVEIVGAAARSAVEAPWSLPYRVRVTQQWDVVDVTGPPTSARLRAWPLAERTVLLEGALSAAGVDRRSVVVDDRVRAVLLDSAVLGSEGAAAGASVEIDAVTGGVAAVQVRVAAGDPLDEVVLRSYCIGAAHMALGWVLTEGIAVDRETGDPLDLTIRSFGVIRAAEMPRVDIEIVDDPSPPLAHASDAVFAAVAAATWNAVSGTEGVRPTSFPARDTAAGRAARGSRR